jgi:hypothetical protein
MPPWDSDTWIAPELPAMSLQHASSWRRLAITWLLATLTIAGFSCITRLFTTLTWIKPAVAHDLLGSLLGFCRTEAQPGSRQCAY